MASSELLREFILTPDIFDPTMLENQTDLQREIRKILRGILPDGCISDLHKGRMIALIRRDRIDNLPEALKQYLVSRLELLDNRHRIIRHPKRQDRQPQNDREWLMLANETRAACSLTGIIATEQMLHECGLHTSDQMLVELATATDSDIWNDRANKVSVVRSEQGFDMAFCSLLRYAKTATLIDPNMVCEPRFAKTIKLCIAHLGHLLADAPKPREMHLHIRGPRPHFRVDEPTDVRDILRRWERELTGANRLMQHHITVSLWDDRGIEDDMHDRFVITDQCVVEIPGGLDCPYIEGYGPQHLAPRTNFILYSDDTRDEIGENDRDRQSRKHPMRASESDLQEAGTSQFVLQGILDLSYHSGQTSANIRINPALSSRR